VLFILSFADPYYNPHSINRTFSMDLLLYNLYNRYLYIWIFFISIFSSEFNCDINFCRTISIFWLSFFIFINIFFWNALWWHTNTFLHRNKYQITILFSKIVFYEYKIKIVYQPTNKSSRLFWTKNAPTSFRFDTIQLLIVMYL